MAKYLFKQINIKKQFFLFFLCGTVFNKKDNSDKRIVLKNYIESINNKYKAVILEQNFFFRKKSTKDYLAYDEIFLKNLFDVESLMSLLSDKIFIIHESISTAAELGIFASNEDIVHKMCLLVPDKINVEENKVSAFIDYAFLKRRPSVKVIYYYPVVELNKVSLKKSDYHTYFYNDTIKGNLSDKINNFIVQGLNPNIDLKIKKSPFNKALKDCISYHVTEDDKLQIYLPIEVIKTHIISLFNIDEFRKTIRNTHMIIKSVNETEKMYKEILVNTISEILGLTFEKKNVSYKLVTSNPTSLSLRQVIGYVLYLLQAMDMIQLPSCGEKFTIKTKFEALYKSYGECLEPMIEKKLSL